jgi:hypothetical protein
MKAQLKKVKSRSKRLSYPVAVLPDTPEEFKKGYSDGYKGLPCRPTSIRYLEGYGRGKCVRYQVSDVR